MLRRDRNWEFLDCHGSRYIFRNCSIPQPYERVAIHFHPGDTTFREPALLRMLLDQICWTEQSLRADRVIK